jgi:hypothetical protein
MRLRELNEPRLLDTLGRPGSEVLLWRMLTLRVAPALWLCGATHDGAPVPARASLLERAIRPTTRVAHLHVHLGNISSEDAVWATVAAAISKRPEDPLPTPFSDDPRGRRWRSALLRAQLAWGLLAAHQGHGDIEDFPRCTQCLGHPQTAAQVAHLLTEEATAPVDPTDALWDTVPTLRAVHNPTTLSSRIELDRALLAGWLRRLEGEAADHTGVHLLSQVLRARTLLHQQLTMDATQPSLSDFAAQAGILSRLQQRPSAVSIQDQLTSGDLRTLAIETRSNLPAKRKGARSRLKTLSSHAKTATGEQGFIVHFSRSHGLAPDKCPWPKVFRDKVRRQGRYLREWMDQTDDALATLRALDVAGRELDGPLWLFAPTIRSLRERSEQLSALSRAADCRPLGVTVHVGEEFRTAAGGLRAIHEALEWSVVRRGDRLGHALALGIDIETWTQRHSSVHQPRLERLWDIAWMLHVSTAWQLDAPATLLRKLEEEGLQLAASIWGKDIVSTRSQLIQLWRDLGDPAFGTDWHNAIETQQWRPPPRASLTTQLLFALMDDHRHDAWRRSQQRTSVSTLPVAKLLTQAQRRLAAEISDRQITIEVNPSSNLLIAGLDSPLDQPMFRMRPIDPANRAVVPVCISTDDPLTFATSLDDEYAYAWAGMVVGGGVSAEYARAWLEESARASWRARFTLPRSTP